ncbi:MAG: hypothetical protein Q9226_001292 [Calogaya cf. arnoldii]
MWSRLNEDKQLYQLEAATYFSYVAESPEWGPISFFELLVALDPQMQKTIVDNLTPEDPLRLSHDCEALKTLVLTRTAGLLDFSVDEEKDNIFSRSIESSRSTEGVVDTAVLIRSPSNESYQSWGDPAIDSEVTSVGGIESQSGDSPRVGSSHGNNTLMPYYNSKLKYLHRTARDFLLDTEDGQKLCGNPQDLPFTRSKNILRARMAALIQGLARFNWNNIISVIIEIKDRTPRYPEGEAYKTSSIISLRRVCQNLSVPGVPKHHIGYGDFWYREFANFECAAAYYGFMEYIQNYIQARHHYISPYCRGLLVLYAAQGAFNHSSSTGAMALVSWLASNGADLHTPIPDVLHSDGSDHPFSPASGILDSLRRSASFEDETFVARNYDALCTILPYLVSRSCNNLIKWSSKKSLRWSVVSGWMSDWTPGEVLVQMSSSKLFYLVMEEIEQRIPCRPERSLPDTDTEPLIKVLLLHQKSDIFVCPSEEDSLYLGEPLDTVLFQENLSAASKRALVEDFDARVNEVRERSPNKNLVEWKEQYTAMLKERGVFADASGMSPEALGDKWFV